MRHDHEHGTATDGDYSNWNTDALLAEISKRRLVNPIAPASFPDPGDRHRRLVSLLEGDDRLLARHPEILKYGYQVEGYEYTGQGQGQPRMDSSV